MLKRSVSVFVLAVAAAPLTLSAATVQDLQSQINELMAQITALQEKIAAASGTATASSQGDAGTLCFEGARTLKRGMRGDNVFRLQRFLKATGFFQEEPTG